MSIEISLNEKFDVLVDGFENNIVDARNIVLEGQQLFFREVEDLEGKFLKNIRTLCFDLIEKYLREEPVEGEGEGEEVMTEDAITLVSNQRTIIRIKIYLVNNSLYQIIRWIWIIINGH